MVWAAWGSNPGPPNVVIHRTLSPRLPVCPAAPSPSLLLLLSEEGEELVGDLVPGPPAAHLSLEILLEQE